MSHFLLKTEPSEYSIDDFARDGVTSWFGVRNYQARNILRDDIKIGDLCIFYHSSCKVPAAVGVGEVVKGGYPDTTQFDATSTYYDATSQTSNPRWISIDLQFIEKFKESVTLTKMRTIDTLSDMRLLAQGNRLSVMSITQKHFKKILALSKI